MIPISKLSPGPVIGTIIALVFLIGLATSFYLIGKLIARLFF